MSKFLIFVALCIGLILDVNLGVAQTTETIQPSTDDSQLRKPAPTANYGSDARMDVDPNTSDMKRGVVKFDLSSIPGGSTINWATLTLYVTSTFGSARTIDVHRITRSWSEGTVTWNSPWTSAGGDYDGTATDGTTLTWPADGIDDPVTWDVTDDVVDFFDATHTNYGWLLKDNSEGEIASYYWAFHTSEGASSTFRPKLEVNYTAAGLPVEMVFFSSVVKKSNVELEWVTASETNNDKFEIEKSLDTKQWSKIGTVFGNGTSFMTNNYHFTDKKPKSGSNYYRLRQIDYDGTEEYSNTIVASFKSNISHQIYPIPVKNELHIMYKNCDGDVAVQVYSQFGTEPSISFFAHQIIPK